MAFVATVAKWILPSVLWFFLLVLATLTSTAAQDIPTAHDLSGARIVQDHGWPELQVDGKPFFVHGAAFDYFGVPQDLWAHSLDRYRELGINTIDVTIPWNWHETAEGEFDFDGHTNPRRDLHGLLRLIADRGFKLIVHAGPQMPPTWRLAGYPEWLLRAPEFGMTAEQLADGTEPPIAADFHRDAEVAAGEWLTHETMVHASQEWFAALARELAPYDSHKKITIDPPDTWGNTTSQDTSGPLLFIIVGDGFSDRPRFGNASVASRESGAENLSRYAGAICSELMASGVDAPCLVSRGDLEQSGLDSLAADYADAAAAAAQSAPEGIAGQWIFSPTEAHADLAAPMLETLTADDADTLGLLADTLRQQPNIPALITSFHAGGYAAPYEVSPLRVAASATIVGTRLLIGRGIGGVEYAPLQDSLIPAGYETPGVNRYMNRDTALDIEGARRTQAAAIERNGRLVKAWGERLASAHLRSDLGIIDLRAETTRAETRESDAGHGPTFNTKQERLDRDRAERVLEQVIRVTELAGRTPEVLDPATQSVERLLRDPVLILVAPKTDAGAEEILPERAQQALTEYVSRGGTLIAESAAPTLPGLAALWNGSGSESRMENGPDAIRRAYGDGATIEWAQDFYSWVEPDESLTESRAHPEAAWATAELARLMDRAGAPAVIHRSEAAPPDDSFVLSELVGQESGGPVETLGARCGTRPLCAAGLLSATNLDTSRAAEADFDVLAPSDTATGKYQGTLRVHVAVPPGESLLLPLHAPLCGEVKPAESCSDEIISSGAELLSAEREKNVLELIFYAPMSAKVLLRLQSQPDKVELDDNSVDGQWSKVVHAFEVNVLRGAAPDYVRVVKIYLRYTPKVAEKLAPQKHPPSAFDVSVLSAMRLPLGQGPSLGSAPALILAPHGTASEEKGERVILRTNNRGDRTVSFTAHLEGPLTASDLVHVDPGDTIFTSMKAIPDPLSPPVWAADGRLPGQLNLTSGERQLQIPLTFQEEGSGGFFHFTYDFERDGSPEWVVGSGGLRLFLSPRDGGRMLAIDSAASGENFTTTVGALRDWFLMSGDSEPRDFTFNRAYSAEWTDAGAASSPASEAGDRATIAQATSTAPGVRMRYDAPEAGAAGASIEKTIRLISPTIVEASYRVSLKPADGISSSTPPVQFVAASSLPAASGEDRSTQFCWIEPATQSGYNGAADRARELDRACARYEPLGAPIESPVGVKRLEIRTPGHAALDFEWTAGIVTVVMKSDSVLLEVAISLVADLPAETTLRYTVGPEF
ncbi:MAG: beta-galactosidase [Candidatus Acidiferrales bacterium]